MAARLLLVVIPFLRPVVLVGLEEAAATPLTQVELKEVPSRPGHQPELHLVLPSQVMLVLRLVIPSPPFADQEPDHPSETLDPCQ